MTHEYDVCVLGAGPGGYVAAIRAAQLGLKTCIIEKRYWGGVCLNVGCIPTKSLLRNAELAHIVTHEAAAFGIQGDITVDYGKAFSRSRQVSERMTKGIHFLMKKNKIKEFNGWGTFVDAHTIDVADDNGATTRVTFNNVIIAAGSTTKMLPGTRVSANVVTYEEQILADAQSAMRQIRQIIHASTPAAEAVRDDGSWVAVLKEYRTLLAAAGLELRPSVPSEQELAEVLDGPRLSVLAVALREGCLNALKYAGRGTSVRVQVVLDPDQVELMVRSTTAPSGTPEEAWRRGLEGGMGLTMLTRRAEQVGGYVSYGPLKDDWLLGVALPYPAAGVGTDHGTDEVPLDKEEEHD